MLRFLFFLLLSCCFHTLLYCQQNTYQHFRWTDIQHPLRKSTGPEIESNNNRTDTKGNFWQSKPGSVSGKITLYTNNLSVDIAADSKEKPGFKYDYYTMSVDEQDNKYVLAKGTFSTNTSNTGDPYVIIYQPGAVRYLHPRDINDPDTTDYFNWMEVYATNNHLLVIGYTKFVWGNSDLKSIKYSDLGFESNINVRYIFRDSENTLHYVTSISGGYVVVSFHADGTYQRRFADQKIVNFNFNQSEKKLNLFTNNSVIHINGKTEKIFKGTGWEKILGQSYTKPFNISHHGYTLTGLLSYTGILVQKDSTIASYLFESHPEVGKSPINFSYYTFKHLNLQDDSTLAICGSISENNTQNTLFLFSYKNNVIQLHKKYLLHQLKLNETFNIAYYIGDHTYLYTYERNPDRIVQVTDDTILTVLPVKNGLCNINVKSSDMRADKNFLWVHNEYAPSDTSECRVARWKHDSKIISGNVFYDANSNGIKEKEEAGFSDVRINILPSGLTVFPDDRGHFAFLGIPGVKYALEVLEKDRFSSITIDNDKLTAGVRLKQETPVLQTHIVLNRARCNTAFNAPLLIRNAGHLPLQDITVKISGNDYIQLNKEGATEDTVTFLIRQLNAKQDTSLTFGVLWPGAETVGKTAELITAVSYHSNSDAYYKADTLATIIRCSYDPNDKSVTPAGAEDQHYVLKSSKLSYLIRFENTGNDTAYHVAIHDTLPSDLDWNTLQLLSASHEVNYQINQEGVVVFYFNNIYLPDSTTNKEGAQGYVRFEILPKKDLADKTIICNNASIFFDSNQPVFTNVVCNTLADRLPEITMTPYRSSKSENHLFPNPSNGSITFSEEVQSYQIYDAIGDIHVNSFLLSNDISSLHQGIYMVRMIMKDGSVNVDKLVVEK